MGSRYQVKGLFQILPNGFFNLLASGSNQEIYSECLLLIHDQFEREISYRVDRKQIRDVLSSFLYDHQVSLLIEDEELRDYNDLANMIIRKMTSKSIGWLEEETDDNTLEKAVYMTEHGLALAEFLQSVRKPEKEEYSSYIIQIYHTLSDQDMWKEHPYVNGVKNIYRASKALSKSLKSLSTYIRKIIERMIIEESFESLTENLIGYFDGSFVREYARLTKQQNVYRYRGVIRKELEKIRENNELMNRVILECGAEERVSNSEAEELIDEQFSMIRRFLFDDYERIMKDIKHKINVYLQVGIGRARFLRKREIDDKNYVERTIRYISQELSDLGNRDCLPEELTPLFSFDRNEYIDTESIRYPGKDKTIVKVTEQKTEILTDEMIRRAKEEQEREAFNPYAKERMKRFIEQYMQGRKSVGIDMLPIKEKEDMLSVLSAAAYAKENGFRLELQEGYLETNGMLLHLFQFIKEEE